MPRLDGSGGLRPRGGGVRGAGEAAPDLVLELGNCLDDLGQALARLEDWLVARQAAPRLHYAVPLVLEELLTNTIKYGDAEHACAELQPSRGGPAANRRHCRVAFWLGPPACLCIEDDGRPFDPVAAAPPAVLAGEALQRPIGGLGLHMVRSIAARLDYQRCGGINRTIIVFPD